MCMLIYTDSDSNVSHQTIRLRTLAKECVDKFEFNEQGERIGYKVVDTENLNPFTLHARYHYTVGEHKTPVYDYDRSHVGEGFHVVATAEAAHEYKTTIDGLVLADRESFSCLANREFKVIQVIIPKEAKPIEGHTCHPRGLDKTKKLYVSLVTDLLRVESLDAIEN